METKLKGKHFITTQDWTVQELKSIFQLAKQLKIEFAQGKFNKTLEGKSLGMIFFDPSTRTRTSFEAAMTQLGGHSIFFAPNTMQISHGEGAKDTAKVLSGYLQGIAVRFCKYGEGNRYLNELREHSRVPIINMQCDVYHPAQILADYFTIMEHFGENTRGLKIGVSWTSAPNYIRPLSVPQSLILLMPRFGLNVTLAHPPEFELMPEIVEQAKKNAEQAGVKFEISHKMEDAFEDADIVIPKSWGPLVYTQDEEKGLKLIEKYPGWVADAERMALTKPHSLYMHPLPADRGKEVTPEVIDGPHSVVYQEAENRLHVQKALLSLIM
ncbi:MAG: ornithine carbamoyltransferase [Caldisericaceae bacterium]|nr:ornithine carbamoyltransferase [Caldisericaceae bacterium]